MNEPFDTRTDRHLAIEAMLWRYHGVQIYRDAAGEVMLQYPPACGKTRFDAPSVGQLATTWSTDEAPCMWLLPDSAFN